MDGIRRNHGGVSMKQNTWTKPNMILFIAMISTFLWGCAPSFIKTGYRLLSLDSSDTFSILLFAGMRFTLAGILVIILQSAIKKKALVPTKGSFKNIFVLALFQTFGQYFVYYLGVVRTTGVNASIITGTGALISLLVAVFVFHSEKMTKNKLMGCLFGLFGIIIMNLGGQKINISFVGDGLVVCSQLCYSLSASFMNKYSKKYDAVMLSGYQFFFGGIGLMIVGLVFGGRLYLQGTQIYFVLLYLAIISAVAYTLWGLLLAHNPVSKVGIYGCLTPLFGVLVSAIVLNEWKQAISFGSIAALILIVMAVYIVNKEKREN